MNEKECPLGGAVVVAKFFLKLAGYFALVAVCHVCLAALWLDDEIVSMRDYWRERFAEHQAVVFLGDSSAFSWDHEQDERSIPEMLDELLPDHGVATLAEVGKGMDEYAVALRFMEKEGYRPEFVIVEVNLRAFSETLYFNPALQFAKQKRILGQPPWLLNLFFRPFSVFRVFNLQPVSQERYDSHVVYRDGLGAMPLAESLERLKQAETTEEQGAIYYQREYLYELTPEHPEMIAMVECVKIIKRMGATPIFYFTPAAFTVGEQYAGPQFTARIEQNRALIRDALEGLGIHILDFARIADPSEFLRDPFPTEHVSAAGRLPVAEGLARAIREAGKSAAPTSATS
ncbi:MAG: hypothetical protein JXR94_10860 [Candidatus Hydrogenedentes bacterium]|nr:hypothetical protein [Candidatus Hydrogenedentota bacterium]